MRKIKYGCIILLMFITILSLFSVTVYANIEQPRMEFEPTALNAETNTECFTVIALCLALLIGGIIGYEIYTFGKHKKHSKIILIISAAICSILFIGFCIDIFNINESVIVTQCCANAYDQIALLIQFIVRTINHVLETPFYFYSVVQKWILFILLASIVVLFVMTLIVFIKSKKSNDEKLQKKSNILLISTKIFAISFAFFLILLLITPIVIQAKINTFLSQRDFELPTVIIDGESKNIAQIKYKLSYSGNKYEEIWDFNNGLYCYKHYEELTWFNNLVIKGQTFDENTSQQFVDSLDNNNLFEDRDYYALIIDGFLGLSVVVTFDDGSEKIYKNPNNQAGSKNWEAVFTEYFERS